MPSPKPTIIEHIPDLGGMDFPTALQQVIEGKRITRHSWGNPDIFLEFRNDRLMIFQNNAYSPLIICGGDLLNKDWVTVQPNPSRAIQ